MELRLWRRMQPWRWNREILRGRPSNMFVWFKRWEDGISYLDKTYFICNCENIPVSENSESNQFKSIFRFRRGKNLSLLRRWAKSFSIIRLCPIISMILVSISTPIFALFSWLPSLVYSLELWICVLRERGPFVGSHSSHSHSALSRDQFGSELSWDLTPVSSHSDASLLS